MTERRVSRENGTLYRSVDGETDASLFPARFNGPCGACHKDQPKGTDVLGVSPDQAKNTSGRWFIYCLDCANAPDNPFDPVKGKPWRGKAKADDRTGRVAAFDSALREFFGQNDAVIDIWDRDQDDSLIVVIRLEEEVVAAIHVSTTGIATIQYPADDDEEPAPASPNGSLAEPDQG